MEKDSRIQILDGLRVLAIFMVMIFHFYARYQGQYYSYDFKVPGIFIHGRLGVQLFFIISGFVITLTLSKSKTFLEFMIKRFIRLLPGMVICATFTFFFFWLFDKNNLIPACKSISNLLFSYTFISPKLINPLLGTNIRYIDGSYWSIWTELQFYIAGGLVYFLSSKNFLRNYLIIVALTLPIYYLCTSANFSNLLEQLIGNTQLLRAKHVFNVFNLFQYNCWFLAGIVLNKIYFAERRDPKLVFLLAGIFIVQMIILSNLHITAICIGFFSILLLFLFKPSYISFLSNKTLSKIGVASYSIYLIHEYVGYLIMNRIAASFQSYNWIIPIFLIIVSTLFGIFSYKYLEKPFSDKLRTLLLSGSKPQVINEPVLSSLPLKGTTGVTTAEKGHEVQSAAELKSLNP
jgi:peptidoglycan/LPS O-acetylase OafA/YrhL